MGDPRLTPGLPPAAYFMVAMGFETIDLTLEPDDVPKNTEIMNIKRESEGHRRNSATIVDDEEDEETDIAMKGDVDHGDTTDVEAEALDTEAEETVFEEEEENVAMEYLHQPFGLPSIAASGEEELLAHERGHPDAPHVHGLFAPIDLNAAEFDNGEDAGQRAGDYFQLAPAHTFRTLPIASHSGPAEIIIALQNNRIWANWTVDGLAPFSGENMELIMETARPTMPEAARTDFVVSALHERERALNIALAFKRFLRLAMQKYPEAEAWGHGGYHEARVTMHWMIEWCRTGHDTIMEDVVDRLEDIIIWNDTLRENLHREELGEGSAATEALWKALSEMENWIAHLGDYTEAVKDYSLRYVEGLAGMWMD